jgi:hypothetical protein
MPPKRILQEILVIPWDRHTNQDSGRDYFPYPLRDFPDSKARQFPD